MRHLFHLVGRDAWPAAGPVYTPDSLESEGFVHCSFAEQVAGSANLHFADALSLCAVEFDPERLGAPIRVEDSYGSGTAFPHVYGPVPTSAAVAVHDLERDAAGLWTFTAAGAAGAESPDR